MTSIFDHKKMLFAEFKKFWIDIGSAKDLNFLDVGAGDNSIINLAKKELGANALAIDILPNEGIFIKGMMEDLPFHNNIFDIIYCSHTFEHTVDPIKTISEFKRVLKVSGSIFLATPFPCNEQYYTTDESHYFVLNLDQLKVLFEKGGFRLVNHYIVTGGSDSVVNHSQVSIFVKV